jgi:prepilin-type N-terminal cleavage/methylation domain-containing protein
MTQGRRTGFTLVEMAVVLVIIGLVILTVFPALTAARSGSQRAVTQSNLQSLMLATAAYVQANGCVPCPTPAPVFGNGFGVVAGSTANPQQTCGACPTAEGIPPYMSLGLPASTAHDGWGHWISMRVDPALTAAFNVAPPTKPQACTCSVPTNNVCTPSPSNCACAPAVNNVCAPLPVGISAQGLCAAGLSSAARIGVQTQSGASQQAAVLFISYGARGYGSFIANASRGAVGFANGSRVPFTSDYPSCTNGGTAQCNAAGNGQFINAPSTAQYDDMMLFADRNALVSMLGGGSCQTVW